MEFTGLSKELAQDVLDREVLELHDRLVEAGELKRNGGFLVVGNPTMPWEPKYDHGGSEGLFAQEVVLASRAFGDPIDWEHPFDIIARSKLFISWKTGLSSAALQEHPWMYQGGMTIYGGSIVIRPEGSNLWLPIAYSGGSQEQDARFAGRAGESLLLRIRDFFGLFLASEETWIGGKPPKPSNAEGEDGNPIRQPNV